jgi:hypothetical protein
MRRCGIDPERLPMVEPITDLFEGLTPSEAASFLRSSQSEVAIQWLEFWDHTQPADRARFSLEALCIGADIATTAFATALADALRQRAAQKVSVGKLLGRKIEATNEELDIKEVFPPIMQVLEKWNGWRRALIEADGNV